MIGKLGNISYIIPGYEYNNPTYGIIAQIK